MKTPRAAAAQAPGGAGRLPARAVRDRAAHGARPTTAPWSPSPWSTARIRPGAPARRCSFTATAPTAIPPIRTSIQPSSACSTAASSTPSPTSAAAQEMGRAWYDDGKLFKKMNTFTDFISCGEYLVRHGYTSPEKLFASGGSAGGLLMGAVVNLRPDLFKGGHRRRALRRRGHHHARPLHPPDHRRVRRVGQSQPAPTTTNTCSPIRPYDNVRPKDYPALLVTTGLHDSQVQYFEPAKWVARLRAMKTDGNPVCCARTWRPATAAPRAASGACSESRLRIRLPARTAAASRSRRGT